MQHSALHSLKKRKENEAQTMGSFTVLYQALEPKSQLANIYCMSYMLNVRVFFF